jgi:PTS system mannose-specific IIB component/fructoselysine and glucoselysine-specific PTS system IIB component
MRRLVEAGGITSINLGGIHHRAGRTQRLRYVFLNDEEEMALRDIATRGVGISAQDVPGARPVPLDDILAGAAS